jgi:hypothetical protein
MRKIFSLMLVSLLAFPITACGHSRVGETGTAPGDTGLPWPAGYWLCGFNAFAPS